MEAHHTSIPWTYLDVERSKVKVTRPINAHTCSKCAISFEREARLTNFKLGSYRRGTKTHAVTSKVKYQGRKVMWSVWQVKWISGQWTGIDIPKLVERLPTTTHDKLAPKGAGFWSRDHIKNCCDRNCTKYRKTTRLGINTLITNIFYIFFGHSCDNRGTI